MLLTYLIISGCLCIALAIALVYQHNQNRKADRILATIYLQLKEVNAKMEDHHNKLNAIIAIAPLRQKAVTRQEAPQRGVR
jgi:hypothetical protein